ncbi:MAG TPA: hypothetical protein VJ464_13440 [Blastocatellia bacterium]|nr:hypothetical protein [Blastocatellia bacterium]
MKRKNRRKRKPGGTYKKTETKSLRSNLKVHFDRFRFLWSLVVAISVLMTIVGTIYNFTPKVSVSPDTTFPDPQVISFVLSNDSYLPLHEVIVSTSLKDIEPYVFNDDIQKKIPSDDPNKVAGLGSLDISPGPNHIAETLNSNEKRSITFPLPRLLFKDPVTSATVEITIKYRPEWMPWYQERKFRFQGIGNKNGQLVWLPPKIL